MKKVSQYCLALIIVLCISVSIRAIIVYVETLSGALIPVQVEKLSYILQMVVVFQQQFIQKG